MANLVVIFTALAVVYIAKNDQSETGKVLFQSVTQASEGAVGAVDELSAADIAASVATAVQLDEATSVQNQADSFNAQLLINTGDNQVVSKPQLVAGGVETKSNKDIITYISVAGDTVSALASRYGISADSIRWSNGLSGDSIAAGKTLFIPPRNGIVYTVRGGDTPDSIAAKYRANKDQIIAVNDAEITGLPVGGQIIIPDGQQPVVRTYYAFTGFSFGTTALYGGNGYTRGYCTWHAANRRIDIGRPLPRNLGNASTWLSAARLAGLETGTEPRAGAVLWHTNTGLAGGLGHVAYVEKVNEDGTILVSDMNYPYWNRITYRTVAPPEFPAYRFIY